MREGAPAAAVRSGETTVCMAGGGREGTSLGMGLGSEGGDTYMYGWRCSEQRTSAGRALGVMRTPTCIAVGGK